MISTIKLGSWHHMSKRSTQIGFGCLITVFVTLASARLALPQAGSTGGTIGKQGKSVSGGESVEAHGRGREQAHSYAHVTREKTEAAMCPNIVGVWDSWASGLFGKSDTTFHNDGRAIHRSGISGKWWCESGRIWLKWNPGEAHEVKLTAGGKKIMVVSNGSVGFSRE
jgi:hypothetical protein